MTYDVARQIATYWFLMSFGVFVSIYGFWALKRWILD